MTQKESNLIEVKKELDLFRSNFTSFILFNAELKDYIAKKADESAINGIRSITNSCNRNYKKHFANLLKYFRFKQEPIVLVGKNGLNFIAGQKKLTEDDLIIAIQDHDYIKFSDFK